MTSPILSADKSTAPAALTKAHTSQELAEKIQREFPDIDDGRAHRLIRIFVEHMREAAGKASIAQELRDAFRQAYGSRFNSRE